MGADGKIIVAVDLGTTFSGIAWAHTARVFHFLLFIIPTLLTRFSQGPIASLASGQTLATLFDGITSAKVPTEICYDEDGIKWGFQIPESQSRYQCFKLELEPSVARNTSHLGLLFPDPKALRVDHRNNGERLTSNYLTCLRKNVTELLKISLCANVLETTAVEFIITVPAIWSEAAQAKTMSCAERAGMGVGPKLILEPEAAIMHAVDQEPSKLEVGDIVVVCDAGGGTVDLISYMVDQLRPILEVSEVAPGTGSACGSNFLNRMFAQMLQKICGHLPGWADDTLQEALGYFENRVKRKFNGSSERWLIPVPGLADDEDAGVKRGKLSMLGSEIRTLFDPIINTITSLVQMQINISKKKGVVTNRLSCWRIWRKRVSSRIAQESCPRRHTGDLANQFLDGCCTRRTHQRSR
jgi:hypothetical protein